MCLLLAEWTLERQPWITAPVVHSLCHCSPRLLWVKRQGLLKGRGWAGDEAPGEDALGAGLQVTVHVLVPRTHTGPQGPLLGGKDRAPLPSGWQLLA